MDPSLRNLYQEVILDHNNNPRNFREIDTHNRKIDGFNPLCGDKYTFFVRLDGNCIKDIGFTGSGCAISKSSASIMTTLVKNKTIAEANRIFEMFHNLITGEDKSTLDELGKLAVFKQVCEYPSRIKCAALGWHALNAILNSNKNDMITTE